MTVSQARRKLPKFARNLNPYAVTVAAIRDSVLQELELYAAGDNPLKPKQVKALEKYIAETA